MSAQPEPRDFYFEDESPDGFHEYRLSTTGKGTPELYRDGKKIRQVLDPDFVKSNKLLEDRVLEVLELFVRNAGKKLSRQKDFRFDVQPYVTRLRKLFNDTEEPHRVIKKAGVGEVVFNLKVRDTPSLYRATYRADLKDHWKPYAMGSGALFHGGHWYFCGRSRALNHICEWLSQSSSGGLAHVVTGDPGSGKSAILGYVVTCSDPTEVTGSDLASFLATMPKGAIPRPRILDFAFNLRDRTLVGTLAIVADALRCDAEHVVSVLANWQGNIRFVFDALDEAAEPAQIAKLLFRPLAGYDHLWLLIGSRRPELSRLGDSIVVLDLDAPDFQADTDLALYVERILIAAEERRRSPYRDDPASARTAAEAVSTAVRGNFLVAFIVARTLVDRTTVLDPARERIPRTPKEAFDEYLHRLGERSGLGYAPLCRAFVPLAHAKGQGLPREVWALMTKEDVDTLLEIGAAFIPEYQEDGHAVYRFFHAALAEALCEPQHEREQHQIITETLIEAVPERNWLSADWYTRKYLAIHGAQANSLDALLLDTKFLAVAYVPQLLTVIGEAISPEARRRANWYRLSADRLVDMSVGDRLGQLELTARQQGAPDLARSAEIRDVSRPWRTRWANWAPATPHRVLRNVQTLAVAIQGGTIVSAGWHVQRLDLQSGTLLGVPITSPIGQITKLAICNGIIIGGTAYTGGWDLATGEVIGPFIQAHPEHGISAIAASGNVVASASDDSTIRLWDPRSGEPLLNPIIAHERTVKAIAIKGSVLVSVGEDHVMKFWDLRNASLLRDPVDGEFTEIAISDHFVLTSNGSYPGGKMRRWNLHTGLEVGNPFGPSEYHLTMSVHDEIAISGGHDGLITLWEVPTGRQVGPPLYGHEAQIEGMAVSGDYIVSTSRDNTLRIWNRRTTEPIGSPEWARSAYRMGGDSKPDGGVRSLGITDGVLVSAVDEDIELRSAESGQLLRVPLTGHTHDVDAVATDEAVIASADKNNVIRRWGREDGGLIREISSGHQYGIDALAINQGCVVSAGTDSVRVWELSTGDCTSIQVGGASAVTMTDQIIVAAGSDRAIRLWNRHTGELIGEPLRGHKSGIYRVEVHDDRIVSASWDHTIREWHEKTGRQLNGPFPDDGMGVAALAAGSDRVVIAYNDCSLQVLDRDRTPVFDPWRAHEDKVAALAMQGGLIVSGGWDHKVRIWDVLTGRAVGSPMSHGSSVAAVAVAGDIVISAGWDGKMSLWDLKTCRRIAKQFEGHEGRITSLFVRGDLLISAGWDRTIRRWDLNSFQSIGAPMRGHTAALYGVAVCRETIVSGSYDKTLRLWNVRTGDPICDPLPADARALAVAGDIIIAAGAGLYRVDSVTGRSEFSSNPHPAEITSIAVGSNLIVTGSEDNGVGAWDSQTLSGLWSYGDNAMSLPEALRTDGFYSRRLDWMLSVWDPKAPRRIVEITGDAIHRRYSGDAKIARLYDRVSGHTIATAQLGFVVNNAMFRESSLYLGCRHGLLRMDFPSEI